VEREQMNFSSLVSSIVIVLIVAFLVYRLFKGGG
jgi:hypothetical protein